MIEQRPSSPRTGEVAPSVSAEFHTAAFARMLEAKVEQGYTIESQEETRAVLATRGSSRWFGLGRRPATTRQIVEVDADGKLTSRRHG